MGEQLTFVLTDVESSTALWERYPDEMSAAMAEHDRIIGAAVVAHGGSLVRSSRGTRPATVIERRSCRARHDARRPSSGCAPSGRAHSAFSS